MLKKGDIILVVLILAAVVSGYAGLKLLDGKGDGARKIAVIKQNNRVLKRIDLDSVNGPQRIRLSGDYNEVILVEKGRIRFEEADCPDRICVKTGWLYKKGDVAVCIPNRVIIKIEGENEKVDGITD